VPNLEITTNDVTGVVIWDPVHTDAGATFGGAATWPAGSVLGRLTATNKYARFAPGAADGSEVPSAVLSQPLTAAGAGDIAFRPLIGGQVRAGDLSNNVDGPLTLAQLDTLRTYGITSLTTVELSQLDNA
tara:strand:- start:613 stop:1002 length:390 start_codon:yes stop_codon:yes gene_type:complete